MSETSRIRFSALKYEQNDGAVSGRKKTEFLTLKCDLLGLRLSYRNLHVDVFERKFNKLSNDHHPLTTISQLFPRYNAKFAKSLKLLATLHKLFLFRYLNVSDLDQTLDISVSMHLKLI